MTVDRASQVPIYQQIANELRHLITSGQVPPGGKLPSESELMAQHGVARLTARHAVRVLVAEGLVTVIKGRGAWVRGAA